MSKNDVTGDDLKSKVVNDLYRDGFDRIFESMMKNMNETREKTAFDVLTKEPVNPGSSLLEGEEDVPDTGRTS